MSTTTKRRKAKPLDFRSRFGFQTTPFTREIRTEHRFRNSQFDETLDVILRTVDQRQSMALIAPAGSGKTLLVRTVRDELPEARYDVRYIKVTDLSRRDMCRGIALALGCKPAGTFPALVRRLDERFLNAVDTDGVRPVLILDDVHEMRPETLGLPKVITNFDMDSRLVLSLVLVGQPPLRRLLQRAELEDVARRLAHVAELRLLSREETRAYVEHRCAVVGATGAPFDEGAFDGLFELSRGNLRAIDHLALKALEIAARAGRDVVETPHLIEARKQLWP